MRAADGPTRTVPKRPPAGGGSGRAGRRRSAGRRRGRGGSPPAGRRPAVEGEQASVESRTGPGSGARTCGPQPAAADQSAGGRPPAPRRWLVLRSCRGGQIGRPRVVERPPGPAGPVRSASPAAAGCRRWSAEPPSRCIATGAGRSRGSFSGEKPAVERRRSGCPAGLARRARRPPPRRRPRPERQPRSARARLRHGETRPHPYLENLKLHQSKPKASTTLLARLPLWMKRAVSRCALDRVVLPATAR